MSFSREATNLYILLAFSDNAVNNMQLGKLTLGDLKELQRLLTRKEALQAELSKIDQHLDSFGESSAPTAAVKQSGRRGGRRKKPVRRRAGRGKRHEMIIEELKKAGKEGVHIKEIAKALGASGGSVRVWFYTTGKKIKGIKQVAPATYRWDE